MYRRRLSYTLEDRMREPRKFMQIVIGPRQTGKTTAIKQALDTIDIPHHYVDGDRFAHLPSTQLEIEWEQARLLAKREGKAILFIDEVHKVTDWAGYIKTFWDEDTWHDVPLQVIISGSSTLLLNKGLSDSLKGRFELLRSTHWLFEEMQTAFNYSLDTFLMRGGYPGAAQLLDISRWSAYMTDSIIESTIAKDVLQLEAIRKPALLRRLFELGALYSGQELSYRKILGQLDDKGNTDTIAHYLDLLSGAGMITGLQKYSEKQLDVRRSSPRFMVYDTSLIAAVWRNDAPYLLEDSSQRGRLVESAVGAYLLARSKLDGFEVYWWRNGNDEVDFVVKQRDNLIGIEVKSGAVKNMDGLASFKLAFPKAKTLIVGSSALPLANFLLGEGLDWK